MDVSRASLCRAQQANKFASSIQRAAKNKHVSASLATDPFIVSDIGISP
jgi:hypothetical protein